MSPSIPVCKARGLRISKFKESIAPLLAWFHGLPEETPMLLNEFVFALNLVKFFSKACRVYVCSHFEQASNAVRILSPGVNAFCFDL